MNKEEYLEHKKIHLGYLKNDNYIPEYPKEFMRLYYSNSFNKIGYWLIALAENKIVPITERQKQFVDNVSNIKILKNHLRNNGTLHDFHYENIFLKDKLLKENWRDLFVTISDFTTEQREIIAKVLDSGNDVDSIIIKLFNIYYKPIILWDDDEGMYYEVSYKDILFKVAEKLEIKFDQEMSISELQEKITQKTFSDIIENLSIEQKKELEEKLLNEAKTLGIDIGSSSIFTLLAAGSLSGFAPYLLVTTTVGLLSSIIGVTLPFGIYTALTSGLSYLLGPVGWVGASIFAISRYKKMNMKKLVPAIVLIHSFTTENNLKKNN